MKEFTININSWRCGGDETISGNFNHNSHGVGETEMLNEHGYMCCLGQIASQCGIPKSRLLKNGDPSDLVKTQKRLKKKGQFSELLVDDAGFNTSLSNRAMAINDSHMTKTSDKIKSLTELFKENNIKLKFVKGEKP